MVYLFVKHDNHLYNKDRNKFVCREEYRMIFTITDDARHQIQEMMENESESAHLRFGVKGGGCSRLSYSLGFEYDINEELDTVEVINDIPVEIGRAHV